MNEKCLLDVYYCIDTTNLVRQDTITDAGDESVEFIERGLKLQLTLNCKNYNINKLVNYNKEIKDDTVKDDTVKDDTVKDDTIKSGLLTFNKMCENLKLKSTNETWFFYISSGNVKDIYRDVFVVLLNKNPREQKCFYVINKNNTSESKELFNISNCTICEVLVGEKTITYTNLN